MAALTGLTVGTPDNSYLSLIKFTDNLPLTASLKSLSDGQGNVLGIKISTTQISIDSPIIFSSLTASKLVYLNGSSILTTIADGTNGQVLTTNGAGGYSFTTVSGGGGGITINSTAITSGTAGRILFENASNQVSEAAGLTYSSGLFTVLGTTQQAKFAYDASNNLGITVSSVGHAQLTLTGTSPTFRINNAVSINTSAQPTSVLDVKYTTGGIDTLKLTDTGNWILSFYQGATQRAGFDNYGRTWNTLGGNAVFNAGTGNIAFNQNSVSVFTSIGTGAIVGSIYVETGLVGIGMSSTPSSKLHVISTTGQLRLGYNTTNYASFTVASNGDLTIALTGTTPTVKFSTKVQLSDVDLILGTTTGSKIGTSTSQKLAFWNKTPIVQPTTAIAVTVHTSVGGTAINDNDTFGGYTIGQMFTALINMGILA